MNQSVSLPAGTIPTDSIPVEKVRRGKSDWTLRQSVPEDEPKLIELFKANIWQDADADELFRWKFKDNPFGEPRIIVASNSAGDIVAAYCFMPWKLAFHGKDIDATQMVDAFTAADYRGQSIVNKQISEGLAYFFANDNPVSFAFPNASMSPAHRRSHAHHVGSVCLFARPIRTRRVLQRMVPWQKLRRPLAGVAKVADLALRLTSRESRWQREPDTVVSPVDHCGPEFDEFWDAYRGVHPDRMMSVKSSAYLNWKYVHSPNPHRRLFKLTREGRMAGFVVMDLRPGTFGAIIDVAALDRGAFNGLIVDALRQCREQKMDTLTFRALENHPYLKWFRGFRFFQRPKSNDFFMYADPNADFGTELLTPDHWSETWGDCDVAN